MQGQPAYGRERPQPHMGTGLYISIFLHVFKVVEQPAPVLQDEEQD